LTVITILPDGRAIAKASLTAASRLNAGVLTFNVTFSDLKKVEYVIQCNLNTSPNTNATPQGIKPTQNVVGLTVYVGAGTTVSGDIFAIGH